MSNETRIDLLRHGEPDGGRRYRGRIDDPLNEAGWQQMWRAVSGNDPWQQVVSSPLSRCLAFAEELGKRRDIPVSVEPAFIEVGFGDWEGRSHEELSAQDPGVLERFRADPLGNRPRGAEPLHDFSARVAAGFGLLLEQYAGRHVLVIAHAGVIRAVLCHALGAPLSSMYRFRVDYAAMSRISVDTAGNCMLVYHNLGRA